MIFDIDFLSFKYILQLQLIIARAGQKDSLRWWEDDSLTEAGAYLLERIFPFAPHIQGRKLALRAAKNRHEAALRIETPNFHLFKIGHDDERDPEKPVIDLVDFELLDGPISSMGELEQHLSQFIETPPAPINHGSPGANGRLLIEIPPNSSTIEAVNHLAWTYLQAEPGKPVFPHFKLN